MAQELDDPRWWLREHGPRLLLLAHQYVDCQADAEDVLQEALVRFWPNRCGARDPVAYLYACVRNAGIDWRRSAGRRKKHERRAADRRMFATPVDSAMEVSDELQAALCGLANEQREVVVMKIWGGLTFDAISDVLSIPLGTAQSRYRYAIQTLRQILGREL